MRRIRRLLFVDCPPFHTDTPVTTNFINSGQMAAVMNQPSTSNQYAPSTFIRQPLNRNSSLPYEEVEKRINQLELIDSDQSKNFRVDTASHADFGCDNQSSSSISNSFSNSRLSTLFESDNSDFFADCQQNISDNKQMRNKNAKRARIF